MSTSTDGGLTNSRFNLLPFPAAAPACCAICGKGGVPVVSWGLRLERFGAVYFCIGCMESAAAVIGMIPERLYNETVEANERALTNLAADRDLLQQRIDDADIDASLDERVNAAVINAITSPAVLDVFKEHFKPAEKPAPEPVAEPDYSPADFKL